MKYLRKILSPSLPLWSILLWLIEGRGSHCLVSSKAWNLLVSWSSAFSSEPTCLLSLPMTPTHGGGRVSDLRWQLCLIWPSALIPQKPLFLSRAVLTGLADATWTEEHSAVLEHFAQDPSEPILTIFIDPYMGLKLDLGMPVQVRTPPSRPHGVLPRGLRVPQTLVICI